MAKLDVTLEPSNAPESRKNGETKSRTSLMLAHYLEQTGTNATKIKREN